MITGALILAAGIILGWLLCSLPARRRGPELPEPVCGCNHHYSMHDPAKGMRCGVGVYVNGEYRGRCACQRYAGPEMLPTYLAPEIAGEGGGWRT